MYSMRNEKSERKQTMNSAVRMMARIVCAVCGCGGISVAVESSTDDCLFRAHFRYIWLPALPYVVRLPSFGRMRLALAM
jgi:hypothetical protein